MTTETKEAIQCPACGQINRDADADGFVEGPREYHADCWQAVSDSAETATDVGSTARAIKANLQRRSGKCWSVTRGRGTARGWLTIAASPARRNEFDCMSDADRAELGTLLGLGGSAHVQGVQVPASYDYRREYIERSAGMVPTKIAEPYWD